MKISKIVGFLIAFLVSFNSLNAHEIDGLLKKVTTIKDEKQRIVMNFTK